MGYEFEWNPIKAAINLRNHGDSFEEASTVFADPLAMLMADPDHSIDEERFRVARAVQPAYPCCRQLCREAAAHSTDQRERGHPP